jgi:hypothetical protein
MSMTARPTVAGHRPAAVVVTTAGILVFLGISAIGGGIAMGLDIWPPPREWLADIPVIDSWLVPGLVLGVGFGAGSVVAAYGMLTRPQWAWLGFAERLTRHHWSWIATMALGAGQIAWITIELIYIPFSVLQVIYGAIGVALLALPWHPAVRRYLRH